MTNPYDVCEKSTYQKVSQMRGWDSGGDFAVSFGCESCFSWETQSLCVAQSKSVPNMVVIMRIFREKWLQSSIGRSQGVRSPASLSKWGGEPVYARPESGNLEIFEPRNFEDHSLGKAQANAVGRQGNKSQIWVWKTSDGFLYPGGLLLPQALLPQTAWWPLWLWQPTIHGQPLGSYPKITWTPAKEKASQNSTLFWYLKNVFLGWCTYW